MSRFRIRARLRRRLKPLLDWLLDDGEPGSDLSGDGDRSAEWQAPETPRERVEEPEATPAPVEEAPAPVENRVEEAAASVEGPVEEAAPHEVSDEVVAAAPATTAEEKQRAHWLKTRLGVLRYVEEKGGSSPLRELHAHSESTYFVAHQAFSRLMEELTDEGLLEYDWDNATASISVLGRAAIS